MVRHYLLMSGVLSGDRQSSHCGSIAFRRQLFPRLLVACPITNFHGSGQRSTALRECRTNWRRSSLLDAFTHCRERHPSAQVAHFLPVDQLRGYHAGNSV